MSEIKEGSQSRRKTKNTLWLFTGVALLIGMVIVGTIIFMNKRQDNTTTKANQIIEDVGKLYVLPEDEKPVVAEIKDKSSLQASQEFYQGAENGDYVLIYNKSKIAFLYREAWKKLIRVSPVSTNPSDQPKEGLAN